MTPERRRARSFARKIIREIIDVEGHYSPDSEWLIDGEHLVAYIAFACEAAQFGGYVWKDGVAVVNRPDGSELVIRKFDSPGGPPILPPPGGPLERAKAVRR